jgi:hypothetical protein
VLAKSPGLADHLLQAALAVAGIDAPLGPFVDLDARATRAATVAKSRPR